MTDLQKMQLELKRVNDKTQNDFINKLKNDIDWLCEKANQKGYEPTEHERVIFNEISIIIDNMKKWF